MRPSLVVAAAAIALSGCCVVLDQSQTLVKLYNPQTQEEAHCGLPWHHGHPTKAEFEDRYKCIADYEAKGFKLTTTTDQETPKNSN
jgi:hypothetical protein